MAETPPDVVQLLQQLEPIMVRWYNRGVLGEVVLVVKEDRLQIEERPMERPVTIRIKRTLSRAKAIGLVR